MGKMILIDEFYVTVLTPAGLPAAEVRQIRKVLRGRFRVRLQEALKRLGDRYRGLRKVRIKVSH